MSDRDFQDMINRVLGLGESVVDMADFLGVSQTTIKRWSDGLNLPYSALRMPIQKALYTYLNR